MISIDDVTKTFNPGEVNEVTAIDHVSLHVPEGQFLSIIGGNGSGKSTLLNLVAGTFISDRGSISVSGQDLTTTPEHGRAGYIGRVFQDPLMGTSAGASQSKRTSHSLRKEAFSEASGGLSPNLFGMRSVSGLRSWTSGWNKG